MLLLLFPVIIASIESVLTLLCIGPAALRSFALTIIGLTRTKTMYLVTRTVYAVIVVFAFDAARQVYAYISDSRSEKMAPCEELVILSICLGNLLLGGLLRSFHEIYKKHKQLDASYFVMKKQAEAAGKEYMRKVDETSSSSPPLPSSSSKPQHADQKNKEEARKRREEEESILATLNDARNEVARAQGSEMALKKQVESVMAEMERLQAENKKLRNLFTGEREEDLKEVDRWNKERLQEHKRL